MIISKNKKREIGLSCVPEFSLDTSWIDQKKKKKRNRIKKVISVRPEKFTISRKRTKS